MSNLLRAEWFKLLRNKAFWVLMTIMAILSFLLVLLSYLDVQGVFDQIDGLTIEVSDEATESSELNGIKMFLESLYSTDLSLKILLISIVGAFFIANENANGTIKNLVSIGHSRRNIFVAKFLILLIGSMIIIFSMPFLIGILGSLFFGMGDWPVNELLLHTGKITLISFISLISFLAIVMYFSVISRSKGVALVWSFGFYLLAGTGLGLLSSYPFGKIINKYSVYYRYTTLLESNLSSALMIEVALIAVVTALFFILLGLFSFQRKDLS